MQARCWRPGLRRCLALRSTRALPVLTCLAVLVAAACLQPAGALVTVTLRAEDGQLFANAIAQYGSSGEDTVLLLPKGQVFSLANVTIKDSRLICALLAAPQVLSATILLSGTAMPGLRYQAPPIAPLINNTLVLTGNMVLDSTPLFTGTLDLTGFVGPLLTIKPTGRLFMQYMVRRLCMSSVFAY